MNSPVDQDLLQLVQQNVESLKDAVKDMSEESENEKKKVVDELLRCSTALEDIKQRVELIENKVGGVEGKVDGFENVFDGFQNRVHGIENIVDGVENRVGRVEGTVSELKGIYLMT